MANPEGRRWCFTINHPTDEDLGFTSELGTGEEITYLVVGDEVGENGTPHMQGFVIFKKNYRFKRVKALLGGRCHLEKARGLSSEAALYCKKDGKYVEYGSCPGDGRISSAAQQARWDAAYAAAQVGDFDKIPKDMYVRYRNAFHSIFDDHCHVNECIPTLDHMWIVGSTGIGKSRYCFENFPGAYRKASNKWWCHYTNQENVIIEDIDPSQEKWIGYYLKIWSDHYPFIAERKGGSRQIRPKKIIVTSNYTINEVFSDPKIAEPLGRRFCLKTIDRGQLVNYVSPPPVQNVPVHIGPVGFETRAFLDALEAARQRGLPS